MLTLPSSPQGWPRCHHHPGQICRQEGKAPFNPLDPSTQSTRKSLFHRGAGNRGPEDPTSTQLTRKPQVVIIQPQDTGNKSHPYPHALVAGIERYPSQITRRMSKARQAKRSTVKPFIKVINYNHLMPTRYTLELEGLKGAVTADTFKEVSQREDAKKTVKKALEERYTSGKNRWFFTPLSTF